jgi:hypothetical protein
MDCSGRLGLLVIDNPMLVIFAQRLPTSPLGHQSSARYFALSGFVLSNYRPLLLILKACQWFLVAPIASWVMR